MDSLKQQLSQVSMFSPTAVCGVLCLYTIAIPRDPATCRKIYLSPFHRKGKWARLVKTPSQHYKNQVAGAAKTVTQTLMFLYFEENNWRNSLNFSNIKVETGWVW